MSHARPKPPDIASPEDWEKQLSSLEARRWFTCILHVEDHVSPVQWFHTRASSAKEAEENAVKWFLDGEAHWTKDDIDVPLVFEGKLEPVKTED